MRIGPNGTQPLRRTAPLRQNGTQTGQLEEKKEPKRTRRLSVPAREMLLKPSFFDRLPFVLRARVGAASARILPADERKNLGKLSPEQQRQYLDLNSQLDGAGRAALQTLLKDGKLSKDLLTNLSKLATQPLAAGIDRKALLSSTLAQIQDPSKITQGDRQTCVAASAQIVLAKEDPAEYARLVAGLSSPKGEVTLKNGDTLKREKGVNGSNASDLLQPAMMQYATKGGYDAANDRRLDGAGQGLYTDEQDKLLKALTGKETKAVYGNSPDVLEATKKALDQGQHPVANLLVKDPATGETKGHAVTIEEMKDGKVTYLDPHEGRKTVSMAEFQAKLESVSLPAELVTQKLEQTRKADRQERLSGGFFKKLGKALKKAVKGIGKAIKSVVKTAVNAVKDPFGTIKKALSKTWDIIKSVGKKIGEFASKAWNWVKNNYQYLIMAAQIACMFVPGLQVVALGLAAIQAAQGAVGIYQGIKNGNWKQALMGAVSVAGAFVGGTGALANGALGAGGPALAKGLEGAAEKANTLTNVAQGVVAAYDGIETGNWGNAITGVAGAVASGADFATDALNKAADKVYEYAQKANSAYQAWKNGDIAEGVAAGLAVAGDVAGDQGDQKLQKDLDRFAKYASQAQGVEDALESGEIADGLASGLGIAANIAGDSGKGKLSDDLKTLSGYAKKAEAIEHAVENQDYVGLVAAVGDTVGGKTGQILNQAGAVARAVETKDYAQVASILGQNIPGEAGKALSTASQIAQAVQEKDYEKAATLLGVPGDAGKVIETAGQVASALETKDYGKLGQLLGNQIPSLSPALETAGAIAQAVEQKDYAQAATLLGHQLGGETEKAIETAGAAASALERKEYGKLGQILSTHLPEAGKALEAAGAIAQAVENKDYAQAAGLLGNNLGGKVGSALGQAGKIAEAIEAKNYGQVARTLGLDGESEKALETAGKIAQAVENKDYAQAAQLAGGGQLGKAGEALQKAGSIAKAVESHDYAQAAALLGAPQSVGEALETAETIGKAVERKDYAAVATSLGAPEAARMITQAQGIQKAIENGDYPQAAQLAGAAVGGKVGES
ncbi:MAG: hypothetical protein ACM3YO_00385, partial [Bacteroidota bacterium]